MRNINIWRITLDTNPEDCNLKCIMCEEHSPYSNFIEELYRRTGKRRRRMPKEWIREIFIQAKALGVKEIIPSTMGEPLIYKHIELFFQYAKEFDILINLTTNGTFPRKSATEWAKIIVPVTSDTKISLNGATKETAEKIMTKLNFEKQIANVKAFIAVRNQHFQKTGFYSRVTFQLTFMTNNMHELPEIVKLAASLDVDRIKGHHLWAHFEEIKPLSFKYSLENIKRWNEIVEKTYEAAEKYRKPNGKKILLENIYPLQETEIKEVPEHYECPFLGRELWISAEGKISPCCAPDNLRQQLGDFGYFPQTSLIDVIRSKAYQSLMKNYKKYPVCKQCNMRVPPEKLNKR